MSEYRQVHRSFWESGSVEKLDPVEKLLYLYAISGPTSNMEGLYKLTIKRAAFETGIDRDMVIELFNRLESAGLVGWRDGWCCVTQATAHMSTSPKMQIHARSLYATVPESVLEWVASMGYKPPRGVTCDTLSYTRLDNTRLDETHEYTISDVKAAVDSEPSGGSSHGKT